MPIYEYRCQTCGKKQSVFWRSLSSVNESGLTCARCASPKLVRQMWAGGRDEFLPFAATVLAIVFTDLLIGVLIGLGVALAFILRLSLIHI